MKRIILLLFFSFFGTISLSLGLPLNSAPLERLSVPSHLELEMLDLTLRVEDTATRLQQMNITDSLHKDYLERIHTLISALDFSHIIIDIQTKYPSSRDEKRQRIESFIYPLAQKRDPTMADYTLFQTLYRDFQLRTEELERIQSLYTFVEGELIKHEDNTAIVTAAEKTLFAEAQQYHSQRDYDLAKQNLLSIKTAMDSRALAILKSGYDLISQVQHDDFSSLLLQDVFTSAQDELAVAYYSHIINQTTTDPALRSFLINISNFLESKPGDEYLSIDYKAVQSLINQINYTVAQIYRIHDSLTLIKEKLIDYEVQGLNISEPQQLYDLARISFAEERYDEAESLATQADSSLELGIVQAAITGVLARESIGFVQRHRFAFAFLIIFFTIFGPVFFRRSRLWYVDARIANLKLEHGVLIDLIKKAQYERYEKGILDLPTYNTKMDKYMERLSKIDTDLPVEQNIRGRFEVPTKVEMIYSFLRNNLLLRNKKKKH